MIDDIAALYTQKSYPNASYSFAKHDVYCPPYSQDVNDASVGSQYLYMHTDQSFAGACEVS